MIENLNIAKKLATDARSRLNKLSLGTLTVINNNKKDLKLNADMIIHDFLCKELNKTNIYILSEEGRNNNSFDIDQLQWIIDPIDGTINYFRGFEVSAISICLWDKGLPVLGVIAPLNSNDIIFSFRGKGAWKNNKKINVSKIEKKNDAILATGFPSSRNYSSSSLQKTIAGIKEYKKVRMLGSAAMMLSFVAQGVFDFYDEEDIYIWDVAAGLSLVNEAGGKFILREGSSVFKYNVKASNKFLLV